MEVSAGRIVLTDEEWKEFAEATFAPWKPRTPAEFDAMVALGSARHMVENTGGSGGIRAIAVEAWSFGEDGEINFPVSQLKLAYVKKHGKWPTAEQLRKFEFNVDPSGRPPLKLVP